MKEPKKLKISRDALMPAPIVQPTIIFILCLKVFWANLPQWVIGILIFAWVIGVIALIRERLSYTGVNPLDTYNQDPNPEDAYNQDMGIKSIDPVRPRN